MRFSLPPADCSLQTPVTVNEADSTINESLAGRFTSTLGEASE